MAEEITAGASMRELLTEHPGARRTLLALFGIGGSEAPFELDAPLADVARAAGRDPDAVLAAIRASAELDERLQISARELAEALSRGGVRLLDIRSPQEHKLVRIEGAVLAARPVVEEALASWPKDALVVVYDHRGTQALDACAYFVGKGLANARALRGGIDAWSAEVDPLTPRYS